jgi:hypothetical protein
MKRIKIIIALVMAFLMIVPTFAMAEETVPEEPPAEEPVVEEPQEEEPVEEEPWLFESVLGDITEDSPLYPVRAQLEGITVAVETDESGISSLVITFTDQTIFEDEIITDEMLEELRAALLKKIEAYLNGEEEPVEEEPEEIVEPVVEEVPGADPVEPTEEEPIVEEPEEEPAEEIPDVSLIIELGEGLTEEQAAAIVEIAVREISGLFVTEAFTTVKEAFFDAKVDLIQAMNAWKEARKNGTDEEEQAAYEALMAAREYKEEMEALKDAVELLKEEVKLLLGDEEDGDGPPWDENPSIMNKLESNGIGNGLIKVKGEKPEKEEKPEKGKPGK